MVIKIKIIKFDKIINKISIFIKNWNGKLIIITRQRSRLYYELYMYFGNNFPKVSQT